MTTRNTIEDRTVLHSPRRRAWMVLLALAIIALPGLASAGEHHKGERASATSLAPEQVRTVQRALSSQGYAVALTGAWDQDTRAALMKFQRSRDLPTTGDLDPATTQALGVDPSLVTPVGGTASREQVNVDPAVNCDVNTTIDCRPGA